MCFACSVENPKPDGEVRRAVGVGGCVIEEYPDGSQSRTIGLGGYRQVFYGARMSSFSAPILVR